jgi:hypothetical protein
MRTAKVVKESDVLKDHRRILQGPEDRVKGIVLSVLKGVENNLSSFACLHILRLLPMLIRGGDEMKTSALLLFAFLLVSCEKLSFQSPHPVTLIVAKVHWGDQGVPDIPVKLLQTGDSIRTNSDGLAIFSVSPGKYTLRAFGINRGGPISLYIDFDVEVQKGELYTVDIVDCLPCV